MTGRSDRTVVVTGSNSGIGLATVIEVGRRGFHAVGSVRSEEKAVAVQHAAAAAGIEVDTVILDVTDEKRCRDVIHRLRPWGLVNNAGYGTMGAVEEVNDAEARQVLETMVVAPTRLCRLAVPAMRQAGSGRIVNMSSVLGRTSPPLTGWYSAAKHALEAVSDALRVEVASAGIKVVLVEPGGFRTEIWDEVDSDTARRSNSHYSRAYRRSATGLRLTAPVMGDPRQVARVVGHALTTRLPLDRYLVGADAVALSLAQRFTPTAVRDRVSRIGFGL
jgi:NAD(P)-dependent dehydrogenase (short-subunit alcohol dehydrogenase family)